MEAIRTWAFSVCAAMAACGIALQLMPKSNLTGIFKLVVSVFFLCCLMSPVVLNAPEGLMSFESYSGEIAEEKALKLREVIEEQTVLSAERAVKKNIEDKLNQMGINYHYIAININTNGQSEKADTVIIMLDKNHEQEHVKLKKQIEEELLMDVHIGYNKKE